ncbi:MAG: UDP-N-acetylmuramate--L-alanine ligase [Alphaproteobacteria bacterium]|nr:UDP-N-acetylmuramate--L-alanine ligase [Alphaproteobacteria bacterium]
MHVFPVDFGTLHFTGIGGIGMSGVAELLHNLGYQVQGSDLVDSPNVQRLRDQGIRVMVGHAADNVCDINKKPVGGIVYNALIKEDNPEFVRARELKIPLINRSELLAEVMRIKWSIGIAGTHGKTTTTSIVGTLLEAGGFDPTVINGGIVNAYGTNTRIGQGDWLVAEADEAYGTFLKLNPTVAVVTNIDPEHLDFYQTFDNVRAAFKRYIEATPFYGFSVLCLDHPEVQKLAVSIKDRRLITYGTNPQAEVQARNIRLTPQGGYFDVHINGRLSPTPRVIQNMHMPMPGQHNILNALAGIAVAMQLKMQDETIRQALAKFSGVKRRFTKTGETNGITIIDDYGHHPVEVAAVLKAARSTISADGGRVIAVFQPHRYSRVHDLYEDFCTCFNEADTVLVADVYAAGEEPIKGAEKEDLVAGLIQAGHKHAMILRDENDLPDMIAAMAKPGDMVICMGAGSITKWAYALPEQLENRMKQAASA